MPCLIKSDSKVMPSTALLIFLETVLKVISSVCLMEVERGEENEGGRIEKLGGGGGHSLSTLLC